MRATVSLDDPLTELSATVAGLPAVTRVEDRAILVITVPEGVAPGLAEVAIEVIESYSIEACTAAACELEVMIVDCSAGDCQQDVSFR